ncbi:MAG: cyclic nucleotide-binding domain-containing protein [Desulfobacterales bacterium]|jgi:CRP-like cAMP-binding protein
MYLKQKDIFRAMNNAFVKSIMNVSTTESFENKDILFQQGDLANHFYILLKGRVKLTLGETGQSVYIVSHAGEAFGWSSLIDRETYTASAECMTAVKLLRFEREKVLKIIEEDPDNGLVFFKRLASILGNRLLHSYEMISTAAQSEVLPSFGSGQIMDTTASELER